MAPTKNTAVKSMIALPRQTEIVKSNGGLVEMAKSATPQPNYNITLSPKSNGQEMKKDIEDRKEQEILKVLVKQIKRGLKKKKSKVEILDEGFLKES